MAGASVPTKFATILVMFIINTFLFLLGFVLIWQGAGLIVAAASKFSKSLKLAPFVFSFVFLGILTSTPEFSVGLQAVASHNASIFVGNLLGGILVLFLVVIPSLAIFGKRIEIKHELHNTVLLATLGVILAPALFILDNKVTNTEAVIMIVLYLGLLVIVQRKHGIFDKENSRLLNLKAYSFVDLIKIVIGVAITFVASNLIVGQTLYFADYLHVPAFYIGLLMIALGTDLPELTLAVRSVLSGKNEIAMGDYIGAAAVSTFMFGLFTLMHNGEVITETSFAVTFVFMALALSFYYYLFRVKGYISRRSGLLMMAFYACFVIYEISKA
jgi:cation:H+ antiporter